MNKPQQMGVPIGTSLLLVVFVLLALITFATLSLVSANSDNNLSQNVADTTKEFYAADAQAQIKLSEIHKILMGTSSDNMSDLYDELKESLSGYTVEMNNDKILVSFDTPVDEQESIHSEISVNLDGSYEVTKWQLLYTEEWESSTAFPVFQ